MHIPKTAGSVVRLAIKSLFDEVDIFPGHNFPDFNPADITCSTAYEKHNVVIGHFDWDTVEALGAVKNRNLRVVTGLRNPYDHYRSQLRFATKIKALPTTESYLAQLSCLLGEPVSAVMQIFSAYKKNLFPRELFVFARDTLLKRLEERVSSKDMFFIHAEDLRGSLDQLSYDFGLMQLPVVPLRLNSSEGFDEADLEGDREGMDEWRPLLDAFEAVRQKHLSGINCEKRDLSGPTLNRRYINNLKAIMPVYDSVCLHARNAWPGFGWGVREFNADGQCWRCADLTARAIVCVRLKASVGYTLSIELHSVPSVEVAMAIQCSANGVSLKGGDAIFREGKLLRYFVLPRAIVMGDDGWVEIGFVVPPEHVAKTLFSEISVYRDQSQIEYHET
jgi:hypothetical protein